MNKKRISVDIDGDFHKKVKAQAGWQGLTIKQVIINLLNKWLGIKQ